MTYEQGFAQGEADARQDRQAGLQLTQMDEPRGEYQRGYRDGYTPRSATWWQPARERVAA